MTTRARWLALASALAVAAGLSGCDEQEQGRVLRYEQGVYQGKADAELDQQTLDELRHRAQRQQGG